MDREFDRRIKMIEALEETHDDAAFTALLAQDRFLESYNCLLIRTCCHLKDPALLQKLLDFPTLDRTSDVYKRCVANVFAYMAANADETNPVIPPLLLDRFRDDQGLKDNTLRFVFATVVSHGKDHPDVRLAKMLIAAGASVTDAAAQQELQLELERKVAQKHLNDIAAFKAEILKP